VAGGFDDLPVLGDKEEHDVSGFIHRRLRAESGLSRMSFALGIAMAAALVSVVVARWDGAGAVFTSGTSLTVGDLTNGTTYTFDVRAVDADGDESVPVTIQARPTDVGIVSVGGVAAGSVGGGSGGPSALTLTASMSPPFWPLFTSIR
jgi:hypothetical protein